MCFIGREERKMIATVRDSGANSRNHIPQPGHREMGAHDEWTRPNWQGDGYDVLYWVGVDGHDPSWGCPLVVNLVTVLIEFWMVKKPIYVHNVKK